MRKSSLALPVLPHGKSAGETMPPSLSLRPPAARSGSLGTCPDIATTPPPLPLARPGQARPPPRPHAACTLARNHQSKAGEKNPTDWARQRLLRAGSAKCKPVNASSRPGRLNEENANATSTFSSPASGAAAVGSRRAHFACIGGVLLPFHVTRPNKQHGQHERGGGGQRRDRNGRATAVRRAASPVAGPLPVHPLISEAETPRPVTARVVPGERRHPR